MAYKYSSTVDFDERDDLFNNPTLCHASTSSQRSFANGSGYLVRFPGTLESYEASVAFRFRGDAFGKIYGTVSATTRPYRRSALWHSGRICTGLEKFWLPPDAL